MVPESARSRARHALVTRAERTCALVVVQAKRQTGVTALTMTTRMAIGGATERAATTLFGLLFLVALARAFTCIRRREVALHREWMIRAFSLGLAVATVRPIVGAFFATRRLTGLTPPEFFGIAFWLGFTMHLIAAEAWINHRRGRRSIDADTVQRPQSVSRTAARC